MKDTVYIVTANISIDSGKTFILDPGTLVKVALNQRISIMSGATIECRGTASEPIIFTSDARKGNAGVSSQVSNEDIFWGGISIIGNSSARSSGIITYTRLEFAGGSFNSALLLSGVNNQTTFDNIQISYSKWNAFEMRGGNCNATHLISYASSASDFYISNGYRGKLQYLLSFRDPEIASSSQVLSGLHIGGAGTFPAVSNLTIMRPGFKLGVAGNYLLGDPNVRGAVSARDGARFNIRNSVIIGMPAKLGAAGLADTSTTRALYLQSFNTAASLESDTSSFSYSVFYQSDSNAFYLVPKTYQNYSSADLKEFLLRPQYRNEIFSSLQQFRFSDPLSYNYYYSVFNPVLNTTSPLLTGADFNDPAGIFKDSFFKPVTYRGAMGADNWLQGWANFLPLQTDYN